MASAILCTEFCKRHYVLLSSEFSKQVQSTSQQVQSPSQQQNQQYAYTCFLDGAWVESWQGGVGILFYKQGSLLEYRTEGVSSRCAIQSEAMALLKAIQIAKQQAYHSTMFMSDCLELVNACNGGGPPVNADWRAFQEIYQAWMEIKRNEQYAITYVSRSLNEQADILAKKGRQEGPAWSYTGTTFPLFPLG